MASVGSVELDLRLNRTAFDKELVSLSKLEIPPLNLDLKLDAKSLNKQLKDLKNGDYGCIPIDLCPDIKGLSRKLKELPKSLVDCIPVAICPELDTESLKKQFEAIKNEFSLSLQAAIEATVKVSAISESADSLRQLEQMYAPKIRNFEQLNQKYKPMAESLDELNQKFAPNEPPTARFTDYLKSAVRGVEEKLTKLIDLTSKGLDINSRAINSPRNLHVSSPEPITDAVSILADINRMNIQSSGLG